MFFKLLLVFSVIPIVELIILIRLGSNVGILPTVVLVASTGIVGVSMAKYEGLSLINDIKKCFEQGEMPADSLIEGVLILIGGAMLLTPGILTDTAGFSLIIPFTRKLIKSYAKKLIKIYYKSGNEKFSQGENYKQKTEKYYDIDEEDFKIK